MRHVTGKGERQMKIILASASPRRRELLKQIGLTFEVMVSQVEERITQTDAALVVEELSAQKAEAVLSALEKEAENSLVADGETAAVPEDVLVIGADTVVSVENCILGKPDSREVAVEMLSRLEDNTHEVYTGVTLLCRLDGRVQRKTFHETTRVTFYPMTGREISEYVDTGDCMDKAGAYGIQGFCARYIKGIEGDYNNVVGLPVGRIYQETKEWL